MTKLSSVSRIARTSGAEDGESSSAGHPASSRTSIAHSSAMFLPAMRDSSACGARRVPPQSGQGPMVTARSTNSRIAFCSPERSLESTDLVSFGISPS